MNKFIFLNSDEMNELVTELFGDQNNKNVYRSSYSEQLDMDVFECHKQENEEEVEVLPFNKVLPAIEKHLNVSIREHDVIEFDNDGVGFLLLLN